MSRKCMFFAFKNVTILNELSQSRGVDMEFRLLGSLEVCEDGRPIALGGPRERATLMALLLRANEVATIPYLVDAVWERSPASPETNLRTYVSSLRRRLGTRPDGTPRLVTRGGYQLLVDDGELDLATFEERVGAGEDAWQHGDLVAAASEYSHALGLWRGEPDAQRVGPSLRAELARLRERRLSVIERSCQIRIETGDHQAVIEELNRLVVQHPLREELWVQLIAALRRGGRRAEALTAYDTARTKVAEELGVDPGDRLRRLHTELLMSDTASPVLLAQLPADPPSFTGRTVEVGNLLALPYRPESMVAIDGMAGVGKSTLAIHVAHALSPHYPDGHLFVDLHGHSPGVRPADPADALDQLLRALGVPGDQVPERLEARAALYRGRLAGMRLILVLDNAASEEQIIPLLPGTAGSLIVVTSRRRLTGLDDVLVLSLDVPPLADAVALFTRTTGAERLSGEPAALVAEAVELCGRLPLAVRVAAARLRHRPRWTVRSLVDRLRCAANRLSELDSGSRSVEAAIDLSYVDLVDEHRRAFRLFGLHPGVDLGVDAAAALAATTPGDAERLLEDLVDVHLLQQPRASRYQFHDLVRAHAVRLSASEDHDAVRRLLDHYADTVRVATAMLYPYESGGAPITESFVDKPARAAEWLDDELPNLLASASWAAAHDEPAYVVTIATSLDYHLRTRCRHGEAEILQSHALRAAGDMGDTVGEAQARNSLAFVRHRQGRLGVAVSGYEYALSVARAAGDVRGEITSLTGRGRTRFQLGNLGAAAEDFTRAIELSRVAGYRVGEVGGLLGLGYADYVRGRHDDAAMHFGAALHTACLVGDRLRQVDALAGLGQTRLGQGAPEHALGPFTEALVLARATGARVSELNALRGVGHVHLTLGRYDEAVECFAGCVATARSIGNLNGELEGLLGLGQSYTTAGRLAQALADYESAGVLADEIGQPFDQIRVRYGLGMVCHALDRDEPAREHWTAALSMLTALGIDHAEDARADDIRTRLAAS
jgi:DNA-binding SARP family transcriptional activator/tetratricopeptide (TPR) repeat protein